jgi:tRNA U34 2-thiouridine synthase MnmA/TrmU
MPTGDRAATLQLDEPVRAPAPGQLACLYDEDGVVVGTGFIIRDR